MHFSNEKLLDAGLEENKLYKEHDLYLLAIHGLNKFEESQKKMFAVYNKEAFVQNLKKTLGTYRKEVLGRLEEVNGELDDLRRGKMPLRYKLAGYTGFK